MPNEDQKHYFLWVEITVKDGKMPIFLECTERLIEPVAELGWTLVAACSAVSGVPNTVYHLWKIPDANSVLDMMVRFSDSPVYQDLLACCEQQVQEVLTSMPYNPLGANPPPKPPPATAAAATRSLKPHGARPATKKHGR